METNKNDYMAPELKLIGQADEVVLGTLAVGTDIVDEYQIPDSEYADAE